MARISLEQALAYSSTMDVRKLDETTEEDIALHKIEDGFDPDEDLMAGAVVVHPPRTRAQEPGRGADNP